MQHVFTLWLFCQYFWKRCQHEYVAGLQKRRKWKTTSTGLKPIEGLMFIQENDVHLRNCWILRLISKLFDISNEPHAKSILPIFVKFGKHNVITLRYKYLNIKNRNWAKIEFSVAFIQKKIINLIKKILLVNLKG